MADICHHFVLIDIMKKMDLKLIWISRNIFRLVQKINSNFSLGQWSKCSTVRLVGRIVYVWWHVSNGPYMCLICVIYFDMWCCIILRYKICQIILWYKWNDMLYNDKLCYVMTCHDMLRCVTLYYDILWHVMICFEIRKSMMNNLRMYKNYVRIITRFNMLWKNGDCPASIMSWWKVRGPHA